MSVSADDNIALKFHRMFPDETYALNVHATACGSPRHVARGITGTHDCPWCSAGFRDKCHVLIELHGISVEYHAMFREPP